MIRIQRNNKLIFEKKYVGCIFLRNLLSERTKKQKHTILFMNGSNPAKFIRVFVYMKFFLGKVWVILKRLIVVIQFSLISIEYNKKMNRSTRFSINIQ